MNNKIKIVMVGAGFGGVSIISAINQWKIRKNIELTLVEPAEWLHYRNDWVKHSIFYLKTTSFPVHIADLIPSDTINWINEFRGQDLIFWDIGSNIGLFSIYAGIKHEKIKSLTHCWVEGVNPWQEKYIKLS